jgi:hypothetical protein
MAEKTGAELRAGIPSAPTLGTNIHASLPRIFNILRDAGI